MKFTGIKETCIYLKDLEGARDFYHGRLGLEVIDYAENKHIFFRASHSVLLCFNPEDSRKKMHPPGHYGHGRQHFAFEVSSEDYESTKQEIMGADIPIIDTIVWERGGESFYFEDPEGNVLEVVKDRGVWD
jgi:catechol 2,3-dioxygenase-like lactoylglutathione lyase family enzyme